MGKEPMQKETLQKQEPQEIARHLLNKIELLLGKNPPPINKPLLLLELENVILQIFAYCNRKDLPRALKLTIIEQYVKNITSSKPTYDVTNIDISKLKKLKMDDTEFEFNFETQSAKEKDTLDIFGQLKPVLNKYRKVMGLP